MNLQQWEWTNTLLLGGIAGVLALQLVISLDPEGLAVLAPSSIAELFFATLYLYTLYKINKRQSTMSTLEVEVNKTGEI